MEENVVEIAKGIYWVGGSGQDGGLHCNPYLIVDGDEAVLIDPGSVLDFEYVYENVRSIIPLSKVKYVILHHQDPDFCSSVPLFEKMGGDFQIVTQWRAQTLIKYYGVRSPYYIVDEHDYKLVLESGRVLQFVQTPYLHFPGAITTYDKESGVLFSSDLFGAFSYHWSLYAKEGYIERMKTFHEHYMPSNAILRPVMEVFLGMDIRMIAPQHGSVIRGDVKPYIKALRDLECGMFLDPVRKELAKSGGYRSVLSRILKRYEAVFSREEIIHVIEGLEMTLDDDLEVTDYVDTGNSLWNRLFEAVLAKKGLAWLLVIEPLVRTIAQEYDIPVPDVFNSNLKRAGEESLQLSRENALLKEINSRLSRSLHEAEEKLIRDPLTRLYNQDFFRNYFTNEIRNILTEDSLQNPCLVILSLDNMEKVRFQYGESEVQETLKNTAYILEDLLEEGSMLFRLNGERIACYLSHSDKVKATAFAEKARTAISTSKKFAEKVTASIGVVSLDGIRDRSVHIKEPAERMFGVGLRRAKIARKMGTNIVCSSSSVEEFRDDAGRILIVDNDEVNIDILKLFLENTGFQVVTAKDGEEALSYVDDNPPDLIISEIMLPKMDGFLLREMLSRKSHTKNIPFIITSHLKDNDSVQRAASLSIAHYFKKPYMLSEIVGLIRNRVRGENWK